MPVQRNGRWAFDLGEVTFEVDPQVGGRITTFALGGRNLLTDRSMDQRKGDLISKDLFFNGPAANDASVRSAFRAGRSMIWPRFSPTRKWPRANCAQNFPWHPGRACPALPALCACRRRQSAIACRHRRSVNTRVRCSAGCWT